MMTIITSVPTVGKLFLIAFWGASPETQVKVNFWKTCKNNEHLWSQHTVAPLKTIWHEPLYVAIEPLYVYLLGQAVPIMVGIDPILDNRMWSDKTIRVGNFEETFWSELVSLWAAFWRYFLCSGAVGRDSPDPLFTSGRGPVWTMVQKIKFRHIHQP